jgi:hypothetical protein
MNIPNLPVEKLTKEGGEINDTWRQFFETLINQLQSNFSNEGVTTPSLSSASTTQYPSGQFALLTKSPSGTFAYDTNGNLPKVNVNGTWKSLLTSTTGSNAEGVLIGDGDGGVNGIILGAGQLVIGTNTINPVGATLTSGDNITISSSSGSIQISATGSASFDWVHQTTTSVTMLPNTGYQVDNSALVTLSLPTFLHAGDEFEIEAYGAGGWIVAQNAGQSIVFGNITTTVGASGSIASTNVGDCIRMVVNPDNTSLTVLSAVGNLAVI